jgi:Mrp family chromosome partitioning ATPase
VSAGPVGLLDRKLLFVTGKGGVGKTSVASAIAMLAASRGKRTLVCEVDAKGNLADFFGVGPLRFQPTEVRKRTSSPCRWTPRSRSRSTCGCISSCRCWPRSARWPARSTSSPTPRPGVKEILTVGKFTWEVRERHYDLVVVDASATGHVVGQLAAPVRPSTTWSRSDWSATRPTG